MFNTRSLAGRTAIVCADKLSALLYGYSLTGGMVPLVWADVWARIQSQSC